MFFKQIFLRSTWINCKWSVKRKETMFIYIKFAVELFTILEICRYGVSRLHEIWIRKFKAINFTYSFIYKRKINNNKLHLRNNNLKINERRKLIKSMDNYHYFIT